MRQCSQGFRRAVFLAIAFSAFGAGPAAIAADPDPCKSDDPNEIDVAITHAGCGETDKPGWGTYQYEREMARVPDGQVGSTPVSPQTANYSHLPTTFTAWFDGLTPAEKRQLADRFAKESGAAGRDLSPREVDALVTLLSGEIDDFFTSQKLSADDRRKALAEIAKEVGISVEPKRAMSATPVDFGAGAPSSEIDEGPANWGLNDPTDPSSDLDFNLGDEPDWGLDLDPE